MAKVLHAKLIDSNKVNVDELSNYDLIGFGSGIFMLKHHKKLFEVVCGLPILENKKAFVFSTSGMKHGVRFHKPLKRQLATKGFNIIKEFSCLGFDTFSLWKLFGGLNKNRPNKKDLGMASDFAQELGKNLSISKKYNNIQGL